MIDLTNTELQEDSEELIGILFAISVVSKRLARSLQNLAKENEEGGKENGKNVRTCPARG